MWQIRLRSRPLAAAALLFCSFFLVGVFFLSGSAADVLRRAVAACGIDSSRTQSILCLRDALAEPVKRFGVAPAMKALEEEFRADDDAFGGGISQCHDIAHAIGQLGTLSSQKLGEALSQCSAICTYGCYHGAVEGWLLAGRDFQSHMQTACDAVSDRPRSIQAACFHGLGHGAALVAEYELEPALQLCDSLPTYDAQRDCGGGVFMELYEPSSFMHPLLEFPPDIPAFCETLWGAYQRVCYETAGIHEHARSGEEAAISTCAAVPAALQESCFASLGQNMYFVFQGDADKILSFCDSAGAQNFLLCISGALGASAMSDPLTRHGYALCAAVPQDIRESCYSILDNQRATR